MADNTQKFFSFLSECGGQEGQDIESGKQIKQEHLTYISNWKIDIMEHLDNVA